MIEAADPLLYSDANVRSDGQFHEIGRKRLAKLSGVPRSSIQRMEASGGTVWGTMPTPTMVLQRLDNASVELIGDNAGRFERGLGVRLERAKP